MGASSMLKLLLTHPTEFRTLVQYYLWHKKKRDITDPREHVTSGYDRPSMRRCWEFLELTGRSYSAVIRELPGDLARIICLYYLVLRALDTIEDDMTIPDSTKQPLMRTFHTRLTQPGWSFTSSGPNEKDRQLLVEFPAIITELSRLSPAHLNIITDTTRHMAGGMADYAHLSFKSGKIGLETMEDLDLYCHYVSGLVGEGLSRIFAASGKEAEWLSNQVTLSNAMGAILQKMNILRDFREDVDGGRLFWPREIYTSYGFDDPKDMCRPENLEKALWALSAMTLDALRHAPACLDYLLLLRNQGIFNFCAIPQAMAMATLALCFMNPLVFKQNVRIRKAEAARLIMNSTNLRDVAYMFRDYARVIHAKALPSDPNFVRISVACAKLEQWCEHHFPSFVLITSSFPSSGGGATTSSRFSPNDARSRIQTSIAKRERQRTMDKRIEEMCAAGRSNGIWKGEGKVGHARPDATTGEMWLYVGGSFSLVISMSLVVIWVVLRFTRDG
ncbi:farnesyl-diphosphate farnesyltransferase [Rickenella mellea]|uniref:squalene synthase n=1 Tax=Rickenella mellea TaxID=50990 RepID=A0A4Y7QGG3_9AGAM|nr:farnesyl-diphosphate farnesyltransferase [Rickenella mellea]